MSDKLVNTPEGTERVPGPDNSLAVGQWYWLETDEGPRLTCITHVGSNYVKMTSVEDSSWRIHLDNFDAWCTPELNVDRIANDKIEEHRAAVAGLMGEIQRVTAQLGIIPRQALPEEAETQSQALAVVHGTADVQAHKQALILAKDKTLPELFAKVKKEHEQMAMWMKAPLLPAKAQLKILSGITARIEDRIFTVELYAGLTEELVKVTDGEPADNDEKVHLFQRRHYMDEECLANYEAGGMDFKDIEAFDSWIAKPENRDRLLPLNRCVVAFRIRRYEKERIANTIHEFIRFWYEAQNDKKTFLYIRNGEQLFRMSTSIDFGEQLFPDRDKSTLLSGGLLWTRQGSEVISQREYDARVAKYNDARKEHAKELREWKRRGKKGIQPYFWDGGSGASGFELCTPENVYYDDAMAKVSQAMLDHNRVAVVLQGLLDRSPAFHPHPPWQLWTAEGFAAGIELVYDSTRVLTPGEAPDFEAYRARLNSQLKRGSMTVGQRRAWMNAEDAKDKYRRERMYGNPGPGVIAKVARLGRDGSCSFEWGRQRQRPAWVSDPDKPGWMKRDESKIAVHFTCPASVLLNVDAYKAGDFRQFFDDPRTRIDYMRWAPLLLAAEDFVVCGKQRSSDHYYNED